MIFWLHKYCSLKPRMLHGSYAYSFKNIIHLNSTLESALASDCSSCFNYLTFNYSGSIKFRAWYNTWNRVYVTLFWRSENRFDLQVSACYQYHRVYHNIDRVQIRACPYWSLKLINYFIKVTSKNNNALPNGLLALKGGNLAEELGPYKATIHSISDFFEEEFFETKKVVHLPLKYKGK